MDLKNLTGKELALLEKNQALMEEEFLNSDDGIDLFDLSNLDEEERAKEIERIMDTFWEFDTSFDSAIPAEIQAQWQ